MQLRLVLAAAQAATVLLTWNTWQVRILPPNLPLLPLPELGLPEVDMGWPMLASLMAVMASPRIGVPLHAATLLVAIVADQCRIQPHVLSLAWLLWATIGSPGGLVVARGSLTATWLYAGLHKLTSPAYYTVSGGFLLAGLWPGGPGWLAAALAAAVAASEIALGIGTLVPRARPAVAVAAVIFHVATFLVLALALRWDMPVWPWNLALACVGPLVVGPWRGAGLGDEWILAARPARVVAVALLVIPAGYWLGVVDAFLAHCVYSDNKPRAFLCTPFARTDLDTICRQEGIVLPPAHRLYAPFFRGIGRPGEWLEVEDPRWIAHARGFAHRKITWNDVAPTADQRSGTR